MTRIPKHLSDQLRPFTEQVESLRPFTEQVESLRPFTEQVESHRPFNSADEYAKRLKSITVQMGLIRPKAFEEYTDRLSSITGSVTAASIITGKNDSLRYLSSTKLFTDQLMSMSLTSLINDRLKLIESISSESMALERARYLSDTAELYKKISDEFAPFRSQFSDITVQDDTVFVSGEHVDIVDIDTDIQSLFDESQNLEDYLIALIGYSKRLKGPAKLVFFWLVEKIFIGVIIGLIVNVNLTPKYEEWWKEFSGDNSRMEQKKIIQEANDRYLPCELEAHRFVIAKSGLFVRSVGKKSGDIIGGIPFGIVVEVIDKDKNWSFVEYIEPDTEEIMQGWVFTRYLKKFQ